MNMRTTNNFKVIITSLKPAGKSPKIFTCLVLDLKVDSSREDADDCPDPVQPNELQAVLVDPEHHLKAARHRLNVLVVLLRQQDEGD